jgi:hypothetical protein
MIIHVIHRATFLKISVDSKLFEQLTIKKHFSTRLLDVIHPK